MGDRENGDGETARRQDGETARRQGRADRPITVSAANHHSRTRTMSAVSNHPSTAMRDPVCCLPASWNRLTGWVEEALMRHLTHSLRPPAGGLMSIEANATGQRLRSRHLA